MGRSGPGEVPPRWLGALVEQGREAVAAFGPDGTLVYANRAAEELLGHPPGALLGTDAFALVHPDDLARVGTVMTGMAVGARPLPGLIRLRRADGEWALYELSPSPVEAGTGDGDGPGPLTAVTIRDTAHADAQWMFLTALSAGAELHHCFTVLADGLSTTTDGPMGIAYDTGGERRVAGPLDPPLAGVAPDGRLDTTGGAPWTVAARSARPVAVPLAEVPEPWRSRAAAIGAGACVVVPVPDPASVAPALIVQWPPAAAMADLLVEALARRPLQAITLALDRRDAQRRLEHLAHRDALTGLCNRGRFFAGLADMARRDRPYGVLYVDLDRFKPVNDRLGHDVGDHTLVVCARRMERTVAPGDLVARLGGDEFAIACPDVPLEALEERAARVVDALGQPFRIGEHLIDVGASVGVARSEGHDAPDAVVAAADAALYEAKRAGRSTWRRAASVGKPVDGTELDAMRWSASPGAKMGR
ncbi:MAG TPA: GGDEF domain-containing protein [Iamia sp.]|nr:GGDEF domain-containing protein [Iamia sp.]